MGAVGSLKIFAVAIIVWFAFFALALLGVFVDYKPLAFVGAFGLVATKIVASLALFWWVVNVAFAVAEWTDERHSKFTKWD